MKLPKPDLYEIRWLDAMSVYSRVAHARARARTHTHVSAAFAPGLEPAITRGAGVREKGPGCPMVCLLITVVLVLPRHQLTNRHLAILFALESLPTLLPS